MTKSSVVDSYRHESVVGEAGEIEPVFIQVTEPGKVKEDLPFVERDSVVCIVKHWSEGKYIGLRWKKVDWQTLITGGVEVGQTHEQAGASEIEQETGYTDFRFVKDLGLVHSKFFHVPKQQNRFAHSHILFFELQSDRRHAVSDEENQNHVVEWVSADEMEDFLNNGSHIYAWSVYSRFIGG